MLLPYPLCGVEELSISQPINCERYLSIISLFPPETQPNRVGRYDQTRQVGVVWVGLRATSKHLRKSNRMDHPAK